MLHIRKATMTDLDQITEIYHHAREFMIKTGNPSQWGRIYPTHEMMIDDIKNERCHVIFDDFGIHGVFALFYGDDEQIRYVIEADPVGVLGNEGSGKPTELTFANAIHSAPEKTTEVINTPKTGSESHTGVNTPKTGDDSHIMLWGMLAVISLALIVLLEIRLVMTKRREKKDGPEE